MSNAEQTQARGSGPQPGPTAVALAAQQRLRTSAYAALRNVRCTTEAGVLILQGHVSSFYLKQLAQEIIRQADRACHIVNQLEVEDRSRSATNGQDKSGSKFSFNPTTAQR